MAGARKVKRYNVTVPVKTKWEDGVFRERHFDKPKGDVPKHPSGAPLNFCDPEFARKAGQRKSKMSLAKVDAELKRIAENPLPEGQRETYLTPGQMRQSFIKLNAKRVHANCARAFEIIANGMDGQFACPACGEANVGKISPTQITSATEILNRFHGRTDSKIIIRITNQEMIELMMGAVSTFFSPTKEQMEDFASLIADTLNL